MLPLGIGAAVLLLYLGTRKKDNAQSTTTTDAAVLPPELKQGESSLPQIEPAPAPSYTQASKTTDSGEDKDNTAADDGVDKTDEDDGSEDQLPENTSSSLDDEDDSGTAQDEGSFVRSARSVIQPQSRQIIPATAPAYMPATSTNATANNRQLISRAKFVARQAVKPTPRMTDAKRGALVLARQKLRSNTRPPASQRVAITPATTPPAAIQPAQVPFVSVTSNSNAPIATPAPVRQTTIFPLKFGMTNPYVKEVQRKLGVPTTGYFGAMTRTAIQKRFRATEISEALYKQIITGKRVVTIPRKPVVNAANQAKRPLPKKYNKVKRK